MCAVDEAAVERAAPARPEGVAARWSAALLSRPWIAPLTVLGCVAIAAGGIAATDPTDDTGPTTCLFKMTTGFDCPGCGGTRAFYYLVTANLPEAARHHALAVFAAPFLVWMYLAWALPRCWPRAGRRLPVPRLTPGVLTSFLIAWTAFSVARNLPWEPFTLFYV